MARSPSRRKGRLAPIGALVVRVPWAKTGSAQRTNDSPIIIGKSLLAIFSGLMVYLPGVRQQCLASGKNSGFLLPQVACWLFAGAGLRRVFTIDPALCVVNQFLDAVRVCSLGQITHALFEVGGQYRRSM